jgi:hypothetical protein
MWGRPEESRKTLFGRFQPSVPSRKGSYLLKGPGRGEKTRKTLVLLLQWPSAGSILIRTGQSVGLILLRGDDTNVAEPEPHHLVGAVTLDDATHLMDIERTGYPNLEHWMRRSSSIVITGPVDLQPKSCNRQKVLNIGKGEAKKCIMKKKPERI